MRPNLWAQWNLVLLAVVPALSSCKLYQQPSSSMEPTLLFARPQFIYFSKSRASGDIRWNRIGRSIRDSL